MKRSGSPIVGKEKALAWEGLTHARDVLHGGARQAQARCSRSEARGTARRGRCRDEARVDGGGVARGRIHDRVEAMTRTQTWPELDVMLTVEGKAGSSGARGLRLEVAVRPSWSRCQARRDTFIVTPCNSKARSWWSRDHIGMLPLAVASAVRHGGEVVPRHCGGRHSGLGLGRRGRPSRLWVEAGGDRGFDAVGA
jgi:hypothetical protein